METRRAEKHSDLTALPDYWGGRCGKNGDFEDELGCLSRLEEEVGTEVDCQNCPFCWSDRLKSAWQAEKRAYPNY